MFREIRTKFTIFNALTLILFLVIFIAVLIIVINRELSSSGREYLKEVAAVTIDNTEADSGNFHAQIPSYYIIYNSDGAILSQSVNDDAVIERAHQNLLDSGEDGFSRIDVDGTNYRSYTEQFKDGNETRTIQVFQDQSIETGIITFICTLLAFIGFIGLVCLIPLSYFLAGKSLGPIKKSFNDQKQFIADASHELRTPLSVVQSNVELLELKSDETIGENEKWLGNIREECEDMNALITQLLLIAQSDSHKLEYADERFDLSELVIDTAEAMEPNYLKKGIDLYTDVEAGIDYTGDMDKLRQIIVILLDNALKYTPEKGKVKISLDSGKKDVLLTVLDTGVGISEEDRERIFDRFYRCDNARSRETGGSGLGLNIAKTFVDAYGGDISVSSELDVGTEFVVQLPVGKNR